MSDDDRNGDGHSGHFTHRRVDAASAPPAGGNTSLSSPFMMGRNTPPVTAPVPAPPEAGATQNAAPAARPGSMAARAMATFAACGPLTSRQLAEGMGCTPKQAANICVHAVAGGRLIRTKEGGQTTFSLADAAGQTDQTKTKSGFKHWLEKKGEQPATAPRGPAAAKAPATPTKRAVTPESGPTAPTLSCGLFNDGTLLISAGTETVSLSRQQTRELVAYLDLIASAIGGGL